MQTPANCNESYRERKIEIPIIERVDRNLLRISHHFYTLESEIDTLADRRRPRFSHEEVGHVSNVPFCGLFGRRARWKRAPHFFGSL